MSLPTQETQAIAVANQIIALTAGTVGLSRQIAIASASWTNLSVANKINAFPTAPLTTTGGLGTADGTPTVTNPIDVRVAPGTGLNASISANNLASMLTFLQGIQTAIGGGAISANGAAVQLTALAGG